MARDGGVYPVRDRLRVEGAAKESGPAPEYTGADAFALVRYRDIISFVGTSDSSPPSPIISGVLLQKITRRPRLRGRFLARFDPTGTAAAGEGGERCREDSGKSGSRRRVGEAEEERLFWSGHCLENDTSIRGACDAEDFGTARGCEKASKASAEAWAWACETDCEWEREWAW